MIKPALTLILFLQFVFLKAQLTPEITCWKINTTGETGYAGIETNVQEVQYSDNNVYISCTCIPGYDIGPWPGNPNTPSNQNFVYKITRNPEQNLGALIQTPLGHIGVWSNGVSMFNAKDAMSYENEGIWNQNAIVVEGSSFDDCLGHPAPNGEYHHHLNPTCLYDDTDSLIHAPIIGYAFDGFPIYGAYGYKNVDGTGGITRMRTSFKPRSISERTTLPDGTVLSALQYGPAVGGTYPLGYYVEDFEYVTGFGDLDEHNGRFCVTPEYPDGIYAYFVTIDPEGEAVYPYTLGETYYGIVQNGNTGPGSGHNTITESVETFRAVVDANNSIQFTVYPNPATTSIGVFANPSYNNDMILQLFTLDGKLLFTINNIQPAVNYYFDISDLSAGIYLMQLSTVETSTIQQIIKSN